MYLTLTDFNFTFPDLNICIRFNSKRFIFALMKTIFLGNYIIAYKRLPT